MAEADADTLRNACKFSAVQNFSSRSIQPNGALGAQSDTSKLWGSDVLHVHILNKEQLQEVDLYELINWANIWRETSTVIPEFKLTSNPFKADIRVTIGKSSWSMVGRDAKEISDKKEPTMSLGLTTGNQKYNRHIVIHEFGHALGLEHEHQRSTFWSHAEKYIDINAMGQDISEDDLKNYLKYTEEGGTGTPDYDPHSIMHYWFSVKWLKDAEYRDIEKLRNDKNLQPEEKHALMGFHIRDKTLAEAPSEKDHHFITQCYKNFKSNQITVRFERWIKLVRQLSGSLRKYIGYEDKEDTNAFHNCTEARFSNGRVDGPPCPELHNPLSDIQSEVKQIRKSKSYPTVGLAKGNLEVFHPHVDLHKHIESPCDAVVEGSITYFRKYRGREIFKFDITEEKLILEEECEVNDTTLVMLPIKPGGKQVLHTVGGKDKNGKLVPTLYCLTDDGWKESPYSPMEIPRKQVAAVCYKKRYLIVVGGMREDAPTKAVEILDIEEAEPKWQRTADISFEHCQLLLTQHMSPFYLFNHLASYGSKPLETAVKTVLTNTPLEEIDELVQIIMEEFEGDRPKLEESLLEKSKTKQHVLEALLLKQLGLYRMSACISDDHLFILGGFTNLYGQSPLKTAFRASIKSLLNLRSRDYATPSTVVPFRVINSLPHFRSTCTVFQGKVLAIGGSKPLRNNVCVSDVYEYQPESKSWAKVRICLKVPRCHCFAAAFDSKLLVYGGRPDNYDNPCTDSFEILKA